MHPMIIEAVAAQRNKELRASSPGSGAAGAAGLRWLWGLVAGDGVCPEAEPLERRPARRPWMRAGRRTSHQRRPPRGHVTTAGNVLGSGRP